MHCALWGSFTHLYDGVMHQLIPAQARPNDHHFKSLHPVICRTHSSLNSLLLGVLFLLQLHSMQKARHAEHLASCSIFISP